MPSLAHAHAALLAADPADGAVLSKDRPLITLHYSTQVDQARSRFTVAHAEPQPGDGAAEPHLLLLPPDRPDLIEARAEGFSPGRYVLHWFVLSDDGHVTRGDLHFSVAAE